MIGKTTTKNEATNSQILGEGISDQRYLQKTVGELVLTNMTPTTAARKCFEKIYGEAPNGTGMIWAN